MNRFNLNNAYADELGAMFDQTPKAVFAALAVSFGTQGGDFLPEAIKRLVDEWQILHDNGIVPQKPPKKVIALAKGAA